ncbi:MAG: DUF5686 family protein [Bacteroidales bacterium]|nr:DUF5686 family protein [Bacteroidales bacterium]
MKIKYGLNSILTFFTFIFITVFFFTASGQTTVISGRVIDASTLEPVAFANVYFKNTTIGTTTDFEGYYELTSLEATDSLTVSFVGYNTSTKLIEKGIIQSVNFQLNPSMIGLAEVIIVPGENPAITLLKKVWANKDKVNADNLEAYEFDSYAKTQVYLRRLFNNKAPRDTSSEGAFNNFSVVADENAMPALPVYMSEVFSSISYLNFPEREKVTIKATSTNSLADIETAMLTQLIQKNTKYNFYENFVRILDKNFISPISSNGQIYYKYYLTDSLFIGDKYCYEIRIVPRRKEDLTFSGSVWINDTTFAMKRISVEVGKEANLNFIERIKIQQDLMPAHSEVWFPQKTRILADAINIFISAYIINDNFSTDSSHPLSYYDKELEVADTASNVNDETWQVLRAGVFDSLDVETNTNIDSLKLRSSVKFLAALVNMSIKGYFNLGKVEIGPYLLLYKNNEVEGHRFRLGFRTNSAFSQKWVAKGFLAYGTKDRKFKYNAQLERFLSRKSWTKIGVQYAEDVENLGALDEFYSNSAFLSFASSFGGADKLNSIKTGRVWFETDLFRGFTQKVVFKNKFYSPLSPDYYFAYFADAARTIIRKDIIVSEISFTSFYQPKATFIVDKNERFPVALKKAPAITLNYTLGLKNVFKSNFNYHKVSVGIHHNILLGGLGAFSYDIKLSKCFTPLPYPLLNLFPGNESFFRNEKTFNLMKYGEFLADESAEIFLTYRQDGFILDKIPIIKKLRLRSVTTASIAYGSFDEKRNGIYNIQNNPEGILPATDNIGNPITSFKTLDINKPYVEVSYGIENIIKVFRVEAVHRLTYLNNDSFGNKPEKFGVRISAVFRF